MAESTWKEQNREKQKIWTARLKSWKTSGLTQAEFCRQNDLIPHKFTYWKCRLKKREESVAFFPIPGDSFRSKPPQDHQAPIKLIIDSRYQIEIGDGFSPVTLSTLIRTLDRM